MNFTQKDYILRLIEQFAQILAAIIQSRKVGKHEQALEQLQASSQFYLNTDISIFLQYTPDQIVNHFRKDSRLLDTERSIICADLLLELGLICEDQNLDAESQAKSLHLKTMSLMLYITAIPLDKDFQNTEYLQKARSLIEELETHSLSKEMINNISRYRAFLAGVVAHKVEVKS